MARIPIADIPNAPQPIMQGPSDVRGLGEVNLGGIARLYNRNLIAQGSFDGPARGLQELGHGIAEAGSVAGRIAMAKLEADNDTAFLKAQGQMEQALAEYQTKLTPDSDTNQWVPGWNKRAAAMEKQLLADKTLSPVAKERIQQASLRFNAQAAASLTKAAYSQSFERSKFAHQELWEKQTERGDIEGSKATIDQALKKQLISPEQRDALIDHAETVGEANRAKAWIASEPLKAAEALKDPQQFARLSTRMREQLSEEAARVATGTARQRFDFVMQAIDSGKLNSLEDAKQIGGEYFDKITLMRIEEALGKKTGPSWETQWGMEQRISAYDPAKDPTGKQRFELYRDIKTQIPGGWQERLITRLDDQGASKPSASVRGSINSKLDMMLDAGIFGRFDSGVLKDPKKAGSPEWQAESVKREAAYQEMIKIGEEADAWIKKNPDAKASDINEWLNGRMRQGALGTEAPAEKKSGWFNPFGLGPKQEAAPAVPNDERSKRLNEILSKPLVPTGGDKGASAVPAAGKVTSYGYASDPFQDTNSNVKRIGAWNNKLTADSLAVSPDIAAKFKEVGIGKNDWVEITLSDGTKLKRQYADHTATDEQAKKLGLPPLRGRWDFFSPDGVHPKDGVQVVSFRKA